MYTFAAVLVQKQTPV